MAVFFDRVVVAAELVATGAQVSQRLGHDLR